MKTYKKPYSIVIKLDPEDVMQQLVNLSALDGNKQRIFGNVYSSTDEEISREESTGIGWGDSKGFDCWD